MNLEDSISIRLGQLSRKLDIPNAKIVSLFKDLGVVIEDNPNSRVKLIYIDSLLEKIRLLDENYKKFSPENFSKFISNIKSKESIQIKKIKEPMEQDSMSKGYSSKQKVDSCFIIEYRYIRFYESLKEENEKEKLIQFLSYMHKDFNKNGGGQELINYEFLLKNLEGKFLMNSSKNVINKAFQIFLEKKMTKKLIKEIVDLGNQSLFNTTSELLTSSQNKFKSPTSSTTPFPIKKKRKGKKINSISYKEYSELKQKIDAIKNKSNYFSNNPTLTSQPEQKSKFNPVDFNKKVYSGIFKPNEMNAENEEDPIHRK